MKKNFSEKKRSIMELAGSWKMSEEEAVEMKEMIKQLRIQATKHMHKKLGLS